MLVTLRHAVRSSAGGVTLIELMVTIALMVIIGAIAAPSYRAFVINQKLSTTASDFLTALLQARSEAVRLGKPVMVVAQQEVNGPTASSYSWLNGWCIFVDNDRNATYNTSTSTLINCTKKTDLTGAVVIGTASSQTSGPFAQGKPFFLFNPSGFAGTNTTRYSTGQLNGCLWLEAPGTGRKRAVIASRSGRTRIYDPGTGATCATD